MTLEASFTAAEEEAVLDKPGGDQTRAKNRLNVYSHPMDTNRHQSHQIFFFLYYCRFLVEF